MPGSITQRTHQIQLVGVGRWFPPGAPVSSPSETGISSSLFHCVDITLAVAEALDPNKAKLMDFY